MPDKDRQFGQNEQNDWEESLRKDNPEGYQRFLDQYPDSSHLPEALGRLDFLEDEEAWKEVLKKAEVVDFLHYRKFYPQGQYREEAGKKIIQLVQKGKYMGNPLIDQQEETDLLESNEKDNLNSYHSFLLTYPDSLYTAQVKERIYHLEKRLAQQYELLADEVVAWQYADKEASLYSYRNFLRSYPEGEFEEMARQRIQFLQKREEEQLSFGQADIQMPRSLDRVRVASNAKSYFEDAEKRQQRALVLAFSWLLSFIVMGTLTFILADVLFPLTILLGMGIGLFLMLQRDQQLSRPEGYVYMTGESIASFFLVFGSIFLLFGRPLLGVICGLIVMSLILLMLVRFIQNKTKSGDSS